MSFGVRTAENIYQSVLDDLSQAILAGDTRTCLRCVSLPYTVVTGTETFTTRTTSELSAKFRRYHEELRDKGVTSYRREVTEARYLTGTLLVGAHDTFVYRDDRLLVPKYRSTFKMIFDVAVWRITEASVARNDAIWPFVLPASEHTTSNIHT
jgi:hypothetical protein